MKTILSLLLGLCVATLALGESAPEVGTSKRTPEELEKLLAPIALYPDSLVALILPAATNHADIVLAARFLSSGGDPNEVSARSWDDSVKSLVHYPDVVKWLDENLEWTRELGATFALQPADVMTTLQKLRADARSRGLLTDTPQQKVVVRDEEISIVPATENVIYVPSYDPEVLIVRERPAYNSWLSFSSGFAVGSWLYYDCDWRSRNVWIYHRPPGWTYRSDWRWHDHGPRAGVVYTTWAPRAVYWRHVHRAPPGGFRPIPAVRPPHFVGRSPSDHRRGNSRDQHWNGRSDERVGENRGSPNGRRSEGRDRRNNFVPNNLPGGAVGQATEPSVSVAPPIERQAGNRGNSNWRQGQENRRSGEGNRDHSYRRAINNPPAQRENSHINRGVETATPRSQGRMGYVSPRENHRSVDQSNSPRSSPPPASAPATPPAASAPSTNNGSNSNSGGGQRTGYGNGNRYQVLP